MAALPKPDINSSIFSAMENSLDAFFCLEARRDHDGRIVDFLFTYLNPRCDQLFDIPREALLHTFVLDQMPILVESRYFQHAVNVCENRHPYEGERELDEQRREFNFQWFQIVPIDNGVAVTVRDLTPKKRQAAQTLEIQLEDQRVKLLRNLVTKVSHEFKTPLTVINATAYLLERSPLAEDQKNRVLKIKQQSSRLQKLVEEMIVVSRLESLSPEEYKRVDLRDVLEMILRKYESIAAEKEIDLRFTLLSALPFIHADEDAVFTALENIMENAIQYTRAGDKVKLEVEQIGDAICFTVHDTGEGISPDALPHIFDRFYEEDHFSTTEAGSPGLGLAIVKNIADVLKGDIQVESRPGEGTIFQFYLPIDPRRR